MSVRAPCSNLSRAASGLFCMSASASLCTWRMRISSRSAVLSLGSLKRSPSIRGELDARGRRAEPHRAHERPARDLPRQGAPRILRVFRGKCPRLLGQREQPIRLRAQRLADHGFIRRRRFLPLLRELRNREIDIQIQRRAFQRARGLDLVPRLVGFRSRLRAARRREGKGEREQDERERFQQGHGGWGGSFTIGGRGPLTRWASLPAFHLGHFSIASPHAPDPLPHRNQWRRRPRGGRARADRAGLPSQGLQRPQGPAHRARCDADLPARPALQGALRPDRRRHRGASMS